MLNNVTKFDLMMQQKEQRDIVTAEKESELANIHVIQMNMKDIHKTEIGKRESRSIALQLNSWIKTLSDEEKNSNLFFGGLSEAMEKFEHYVTNKYTGKKKDEWINKFRNADFVDAVEGVLKYKIYEHKGENELFMSGQAHNNYQVTKLFKNSRKVAHEASNRLNKILKSNNDYSFSDYELRSLVSQVVENVLDRRIKPHLPNRQKEKLIN